MGLKQLPEDFKEFIQFLNDHEVHYLLLGGWAVGLYGNPRATKDIDFLIATDDENIRKLQQTLLAFGAPTVENKVFQEKGNVFRMGRSPVQIDIINEADGIRFNECYKRRNIVRIDGIDISTISKTDLLVNKRASGRHRDLADIEFIENRE
ncbi:MAG: nucleotidyltransferase family protein [Candidatus Aegiribacteria sp.]|nr:nucleotidyltransferase family protein [Candidatus Aegiribacteria sp.]